MNDFLQAVLPHVKSIATMLLMMLPFILLTKAVAKANLPKPERSKQFAQPIIGVVYAIIAMFAANWLCGQLIALINNIPGWISQLAGVSWMPEQIAPYIQRASEWLADWLASLNLTFWVFFIANAIIMLVYLLIKTICVRIIGATVANDGKIHTKVANTFYGYFSFKDVWCLRENYAHVRLLLKVFYYAAAVVCCLLMLVSRYFYLDGYMRTVFYPVFPIIIVGELFFYLDGLTKREYTNDILGEDEDAYKTVNYSLLRKFLRNLFGDKLLAENTGINNALSYEVTTDQVLRELESSEDPKIASFAAYYDTLNREGFEIDHNYLYSSLDMLQGKSVLFNNPFYNDLIPYAFYPMHRTLLSHRKVLVVLGRHAIEDDIRDWLERGVESITHIPFLWNIGVLDTHLPDDSIDIGILTRSDVLNTALHDTNAAFFEQVGFVVILEPSKLISTAQIGLNLIVKRCRGIAGEGITYCMCDKNCDGLVDAMSHILLTDLTEVSATGKHRGTSSYMCWEADNDYLHHRMVPHISRYLGMGTELSFAALKNQVSETTWVGGEAFPVSDIRWIAKQYYYDLTGYASLPANQETMDEHFHTSPNFWSAAVGKNQYFTVEDESCNMFEILRDFSTRTTEQGFINVISAEYLLKDYMADNAGIFEADPKAIPHIMADYTRSNRNTVLRLLLMMSTGEVPTDVIERELGLLGIPVTDLQKQLWYELYLCYAEATALADLPEDYETAVETVAQRTLHIGNADFGCDILHVYESFNLKRGEPESVCTLTAPRFAALCAADLRSAGYVAEDERGGKYYLGAELAGHIYQRYLPGQFFTFGGKYYQMQHLTADGQILVRRAADHISGRPSYRQLRQYTLSSVRLSNHEGAQQNFGGMRVSRAFADITVDTKGYYNCSRYNDLKTAKRVIFEGSGIAPRVYRNKELLCIELPEAGLTDSVRYSIAVLFNEVFRTLFAENHAFICALTDDSFLPESDTPAPLTYSLQCDSAQQRPHCIYIVEDSQLDLGLTVAVERNLQRIFSILHDYLDWHLEAVKNSIDPPAEPVEPMEMPAPEEAPAEEAPAGGKKKKKKGLIGRAIDRIKGWFGGKKKKPRPEAEGAPEEPAGSAPETPADGEPVNDVPDDFKGNRLHLDVEGVSKEGDGEITYVVEEEQATRPVDASAFAMQRLPYHERHFLLFGGEASPEGIVPEETLAYLSGLGYAHNALWQARNSKHIAEMVEATFRPGKPDARYCDFCGCEIFGVEYETLADGRDRCLNCGRTAIKTGEEFRRIFEDVKRNMESFYGIRINVGIRVEMVNSKELHRRLGSTFTPTPDMDGRVLGVAIKDKNGYTLMVENGSPRMESMMTMVHELTHIWQYANWNARAIRKKYGRKLELEVYEGMAKWVEIQYAYLINEPAVAKRHEIITEHRDDEYGRGFIRYRANYPFSTGTVITRPTPFLNTETPLDEQFCGEITVAEG